MNQATPASPLPAQAGPQHGASFLLIEPLEPPGACRITIRHLEAAGRAMVYAIAPAGDAWETTINSGGEHIVTQRYAHQLAAVTAFTGLLTQLLHRAACEAPIVRD